MTNVRTILRERKKTHGEYDTTALISQRLRDVCREFYRDDHTPVMRDGLEAICRKMARALSGDPNFADHWLDIEGEARLVAARCAQVE